MTQFASFLSPYHSTEASSQQGWNLGARRSADHILSAKDQSSLHSSTVTTLAELYAPQVRGDYDTYFALMDATTNNKIGVGIVYLPLTTRTLTAEPPRVADFGSGSGELVSILATLYPGTQFVGVDLGERAIEHATQKYVVEGGLRNCAFLRGDASKPIAAANSLDAIYTSSTIHHITSFSEGGPDPEALYPFLDAVAMQLKIGGIFVNRDFVIPDMPEVILLDLLNTDGTGSTHVKDLSTAARFERFAEDFRGSQNRSVPIPYERLESPHGGFTRYKVSSRHAAEYLLHKDYGYTDENWQTECCEEYLYKSQAEIVSALEKRGMRVIQAKEIHNLWIIENRFEGKAILSSLEGVALSFPPTNFMVVAEKVGDGVVRYREEHGASEQNPRAQLGLRHFRHNEGGYVFDLVGTTPFSRDVLPWFERNGSMFIVCEHHPRPVIQAHMLSGNPNLDRAHLAGFLPVSVDDYQKFVSPNDLGGTGRDRGYPFSNNWGEPRHYFTSPGCVAELVEAVALRIDPQIFESLTCENLHVVEARRFLGSCQVGGVPENTLELAVYQLLIDQGASFGPWLGSELKLTVQTSSNLLVRAAVDIVNPAKTRAFTELTDEESSGGVGGQFLKLATSTFAAENRYGEILDRQVHQHVKCRTLSDNTISVLPVIRRAEGYLIGLEQRDLPCPQALTGSSGITVIPAFRLPLEVTDLAQAKVTVTERMAQDFNIKGFSLKPLGGKYYPAPDCSAEVVYPMIMEVDATSASHSGLTWVDAKDLLSCLHDLRDGHSLTGVLRGIHALGVQEQARYESDGSAQNGPEQHR
jgi:2-polyprenyl-3-methyl-5-hydroxy-6-metoxy-1,4-benzoquinol methylase